MKKDSFEVFSAAIGLIIITCLVVIGLPLLLFWAGYFEGWLISKLIGDTVSNAFNIAFNTNYFKPEMLKYIGGVLGWCGGFFKVVHANKNKD